MCTEKINLISPSQAFNNLITCNMILWLSSYIIFSQSSVCKKINIRIKKTPIAILLPKEKKNNKMLMLEKGDLFGQSLQRTTFIFTIKLRKY